MAKRSFRIVKAALIALMAGALVALGNPMRPVHHDLAAAAHDVAQLSRQTAAQALAPVRHA
jgi:hypothetical protein